MNRSIWGIYPISLLLGVLITGIAVAVRPFGFSNVASAVVGLVGCALAALLVFGLRQVSVRSLLGGFAGLFGGCLLGLSLAAIVPLGMGNSAAGVFLRLLLPLLLSYAGLVTGVLKAADFSPRQAADFSPRPGADQQTPDKILDTSVLIDGRISDIVASGFLEGPLVVPRFVLHELQVVADSPESARRARGRRGLDVVQHLQNIPDLKVEVSTQDFPATREVDLKLIEFARLRMAKIVTNDFNLNKLARVQGIQVLNINELANSLKPVVLPGELMRVFILKEGKEHNQGIAYLDDGTMVVVDNARRMISKNIDIVVTSVLQTTAGKMIFGRYDALAHGEPRAITTSFSASASTT